MALASSTWISSRIKMRMTFLACAIFAILPAYNAMGQEWDFSEKNRPDWTQLRENGPEIGNASCQQIFDAMYDAYARKHPAFSKLKHEPGMKRRWRYALIQHQLERGHDVLQSCWYFHLTDQLDDLAKWGKSAEYNAWCGGEPGKLPLEFRQAREWVQELIDFALMGSPGAAFAVLGRHPYGAYKLNDDVRYYLERLYFTNDEMNPQFAPGFVRRQLGESAGPALTVERRRFVDDAFKRSDFDAVLESTKPCNASRT